MKSIVLAILISFQLGHCMDYDAKAAINQRVKVMRATCEKYSDPRRPEYKTLMGGKYPPETLKIHRNNLKKLYVCTPPKIGSNAMKLLFIQLYRQDVANHGREEMLKLVKSKSDMDHFKESKRAIVVRHPLERILSAYVFIFVDSSIHKDVTNKILNWLDTRKPQLELTTLEDKVDSTGDKTLTFRQFVNFLNYCALEWPGCEILLNDGIAMHWKPFWDSCNPCYPGYEYHYVMELQHVNEDKNFIFDQVGLNKTFAIEKTNPTKHREPDSLEAKQRYFGQLSQQEIYDLYERYKLDHELFGYSPDEYIKMAWDADICDEKLPY